MGSKKTGKSIMVVALIFIGSLILSIFRPMPVYFLIFLEYDSSFVLETVEFLSLQ